MVLKYITKIQTAEMKCLRTVTGRFTRGKMKYGEIGKEKVLIR
jgi:hypothetical protein